MINYIFSLCFEIVLIWLSALCCWNSSVVYRFQKDLPEGKGITLGLPHHIVRGFTSRHLHIKSTPISADMNSDLVPWAHPFIL